MLVLDSGRVAQAKVEPTPRRVQPVSTVKSKPNDAPTTTCNKTASLSVPATLVLPWLPRRACPPRYGLCYEYCCTAYPSSDVISLADASFPPASTSSTVGGAATGGVGVAAAFASAPGSPAAASTSARTSSASRGGARAGTLAAAWRHSRRAMPVCYLRPFLVAKTCDRRTRAWQG